MLICTLWHNSSLQRGCFYFCAKLNPFHFPTTQVRMNEKPVFWILFWQTNSSHSVTHSELGFHLQKSLICISKITFGFSQSAGCEKPSFASLAYLHIHEIRKQITTLYFLLIFTGFILIAKAAAVIKQRVVGDPDIWKQTLLTWTALQEELQCSQQRGLKRRREEDEEESLTVAYESTHTLTSSTHLLHEQTPSFRVSCRCSGVIARSYTSQVCVCNFILFKIQWLVFFMCSAVQLLWIIQLEFIVL